MPPLAIGYRHVSEGESFSSLALEYPQVGEVYFPWVDEPSGRPVLGFGEGDDLETIRAVLREELSALRAGGKKLDLLLNANCYGEKAMSIALEDHLKEILAELTDWGCRPDTITVASPFLAATIRRHAPEIDVRASVNMRLATVQAMDYLKPWFDSFYIGRDVQRNLDAVRRFSDWARANGKRIGILANSGCLRNCPWQTYHDNLVAHSTEAAKKLGVSGFNPHLCWTLYRNAANFPQIMKATWIRPEDLSRYDSLVDFVKLATRQHSRPRLVVDAYATRSHRGDLLDLLEPGFAPAFHRAGVALDNTRFPSDWAERAGRCARECENCGYCEKVFAAVCRGNE